MMRKECYEENMREKRRLFAEGKSIADAERAAKNIATQFLTSDEGILTVREEAMKRLASSDTEATNKSTAVKLLKRLPLPSSIK